MPQGFEPQTDVHLAVINIDPCLEATPTSVEAGLLVCPDNAGFRLEMLSITYRANILPVDGAANINVDIEFIDDSDSDAVTNLVAAYTLDDNRTALVGNEVWRGSQILEPGDAINAEFDTATPSTKSEGAILVVEFRVVKRS